MTTHQVTEHELKMLKQMVHAREQDLYIGRLHLTADDVEHVIERWAVAYLVPKQDGAA